MPSTQNWCEEIILSCGSDDVLKQGTDLGDGLKGWSCTQVTGTGEGGFANLLDDLFGEEGTVTLNTILIGALILIFFAIAILMGYGILKAVIIAKLT